MDENITVLPSPLVFHYSSSVLSAPEIASSVRAETCHLWGDPCVPSAWHTVGAQESAHCCHQPYD